MIAGGGPGAGGGLGLLLLYRLVLCWFVDWFVGLLVCLGCFPRVRVETFGFVFGGAT